MDRNGRWIAADAVIGEGVELGYGVVIKPGVLIGNGCVIEDHAVLGKAPRLARRSAAAGAGEAAALRLGAGVTVCAGAIVFAGASIEDDAIIGDQSYVRERAEIGAETRVGRGTCIDNDVSIGRRCSIQTSVYLTATSLVEDDVFVGPCTVTTNDNTMARRRRSETPLVGATLRRACRVGGGAVITPGVEVGEEAFVAAGTVVTRDVPRRMVAMGVPARLVREVGDEDLIERWR